MTEKKLKQNIDQHFTGRMKSREYAVQMMYWADVTGCDELETLKDFWLSFESEDLMQREFAEKLFSEAYPDIAHSDELIGQFIAKNWSFNRIGIVDKSILRLAITELFKEKTPAYAVLDSYTTLARVFGDEKSASFVNGILNNIWSKFKEVDGKEDKTQ